MIQCSKCGVENAIGTQYCSNCGNTFSITQAQVKPKNNLIIILIVIGFVLGSCVLCGIIGSMQNVVKSPNNLAENKSPITISNNINNSINKSEETSVLDSSVEFILDLSEEEKLKRFKTIKSFPQFTKLSEIIKAADYAGCNLYKTNTIRSEPEKNSLTGLLFSCDEDYKKLLKNREYKIVLLGQSKDSVDTIRIQTFGVFTKEAREQLIKDATVILEKINKGEIPNEFSKDFYAGKQMGEGDGVSNGYCIIQALQMPINGKTSTENDRISLDLVFDKPK